ncbi:Arc family DNA-binding protein [Photorhabdus sp. P32]|uniref:Arc family DNA-binding protein n=1 Tax=Photorhabdus sp. P32 TaxID=3117549 RepID=UPI00311B348C
MRFFAMRGMRNIGPTGVRIPDDVKEKLINQADRNGRSLNAEIVRILEKSVNEEQKSEQPVNLTLEIINRLDRLEKLIESQK